MLNDHDLQILIRHVNKTHRWIFKWFVKMCGSTWLPPSMTGMSLTLLVLMYALAAWLTSLLQMPLLAKAGPEITNDVGYLF